MKRQVFADWWQVAIRIADAGNGHGAIVTCFSVIVSPLVREFIVGREEFV